MIDTIDEIVAASSIRFYESMAIKLPRLYVPSRPSPACATGRVRPRNCASARSALSLQDRPSSNTD